MSRHLAPPAALAVLLMCGCDGASGAIDGGERSLDGGGVTDAGAAVTEDAGLDDAGPRTEGDAGTTLDGGAPTTVGLPVPCVCDLTVATGQADVDLGALAPGAVVCVPAGDRGPLTLRNAAGSEGSPILVRNCEGRAHLTSTTTTSALAIRDSSHIRVSGAGAPGDMYGLWLSAPTSPATLAIGKVDHVEVDHVEVDSASFAGFMIKVDPSRTDCQEMDRRYDPFVMEGVSLHHNYIHDTDGEGIYLGNSFYGGTLVYCGELQYPHPVRQVRVWENIVEHTGWDGIQVGSADTDCAIEDNVVRDWGTAREPSQNHGIQVGGGSTCHVRRNLLVHGGTGMHLAGIGDVDVVNNVVVDVDGAAMFVNPRPTPLASDVVANGYRGGFRIIANTLIDLTPTGPVVRDVNVPSNPVPTGNVIAANLIVAPRAAWTQLTPQYGWTLDVNVQLDTLDAASLVDPTGEDFCPTAGSPAADAAGDLSGYGVTDDQRGQPRPLGAASDVGAMECR